jgi:hypothetical protein
MAWPKCPSCGLGPVSRVDGGEGVQDGEVAIVRSYRCPCGWTGWTAEAIIVQRPKTVWVRDFGGAWLVVELRAALVRWLARGADL